MDNSFYRRLASHHFASRLAASRRVASPLCSPRHNATSLFRKLGSAPQRITALLVTTPRYATDF